MGHIKIEASDASCQEPIDELLYAQIIEMVYHASNLFVMYYYEVLNTRMERQVHT